MAILENFENWWELEKPNLSVKIFSDLVCSDCQQTTDKSYISDKQQTHAHILAEDDKYQTDQDKI